MIQLTKHNILFGLGYIILSLAIGECHPFSLVSMYNSFPEMAYTFYLSDTKGNLLPLKNYYRYTTGDLTHFYNTVCENKKINVGNHAETRGESLIIGEVMMIELKKRCFTQPPTDTIQLHQVNYFLKGDSIHRTDILMYASTSR